MSEVSSGCFSFEARDSGETEQAGPHMTCGLVGRRPGGESLAPLFRISCLPLSRKDSSYGVQGSLLTLDLKSGQVRT